MAVESPITPAPRTMTLVFATSFDGPGPVVSTEVTSSSMLAEDHVLLHLSKRSTGACI